jgi:hypothetical protein
MSTDPRRPVLSKDVPYHVEDLWALISTQHPPGQTTMMYLLAPTRRELWESVVDSEFYGTGHTKQSLEALGFVARRVRVEEVAV